MIRINKLAQGVVIAFLLTAACHVAVHAQETLDDHFELVYNAPNPRYKFVEVTLPMGQIVVTPAEGQWYQSANGLKIGVFDKAHRLVASFVSAEGGKFTFGRLLPGDYTIVTGAKSLQTLSLALHVRAVQVSPPGGESGLMLYVRSRSDVHEGSGARIQDLALRLELLDRLKKDQDWRSDWIKAGMKPSDAAVTQGKAIDAENLARIKQITAGDRWPGRDRVGVDGMEAAFLIVQHAPLEYQERMLPRIEKAYKSGELPGQDYALLLDRTRMRQGKKQVYGTQGADVKDWKNGEASLYPIEDEAHVDQRRAEVGLMPLAGYKKMMYDMYFPNAAAGGDKH